MNSDNIIEENCNIIYEQQLLGIFLLKQDKIDECEMFINNDTFYFELHKKLYKKFNWVSKEGKLDYTDAFELMTNDPELEELFKNYSTLDKKKKINNIINELLNSGENRENEALSIVKTLNILAQKRKLNNIAQDLINYTRFDKNIYTDDKIADVVNKLETIKEGYTATQPIVDISETLSKILKNCEEASKTNKAIEGLSTGYRCIDKQLGRLREGELIIIGANTSCGKSSLLLNFAYNLSQRSNAVLFFSYEMTKESLVKRLLAMQTGYTTWEITNGRVYEGQRIRKMTEEEIKLIKEKSTEINKNIFIVYGGSITIEEIRSKTKYMIDRYNIKAVFVDYLQCLPMKTANRNLELGLYTKALKDLAMKYNIPVLTASQLSRNNTNENDKRPQLASLRDSGCIEQDADVVMFIYREKFMAKNKEIPEEDDAEIIIAKNRNGACGAVKLKFLTRVTQFKEYEIIKNTEEPEEVEEVGVHVEEENIKEEQLEPLEFDEDNKLEILLQETGITDKNGLKYKKI